jgi:4-hydroxy-tetrahydrodipicolinate reductase
VSSGVPLVSGSTGWLDKLKEVKQLCLDNKVSFIYASNYSVGVNIFFDINKRLASLMASHPQYNVQVKETHHTEKKDAPSGTAITIAEDILQQLPSKNNWVNRESQKMDELSIISERVDPAPGTHAVTYSSPVDDITIIHTAHNREGFALGAVLAAEYIHDKKGIFSMRDVLNL